MSNVLDLKSSNYGWQSSPSQTKLRYLKTYAVGNSALDLGCGYGWYSQYLADNGWHVVAIDQTPRFDHPAIDVQAMTLGSGNLPFSTDQFDTTLMFDILEHVPDEALIIQEVARVTKRRLIVSVPNREEGFLPLYGLTYRHRIDRTHLREYTISELVDKMEKAAFRTLHVALEGLEGPLYLSLAFAKGTGIRYLVWMLLRLQFRVLQLLGLLKNETIAGDIFWVGEKQRSSF